MVHSIWEPGTQGTARSQHGGLENLRQLRYLNLMACISACLCVSQQSDSFYLLGEGGDLVSLVSLAEFREALEFLLSMHNKLP